MDYVENASALFAAVQNSNMRRVKAALAAGANVNGSQDRPYTPLMAATVADDASMVSFFIDQGVDLDRSADHDISCPSTDGGIMPGERALHIAAKRGNVEIVRLLKRGRADLNATDTRGRTPLMATCVCLEDCVAVVRVLLKLGANPALADLDGYTPLHAVAQHGVTDLVDILYTGAPETLNTYSNDGRTPLFMACVDGRESTISRLLSLGATQWMQADDPTLCPLMVAATKGLEGVVRLLINGGMRAIGVSSSLPTAIYGAVVCRRAKIVRLLLTADGEERQSEWANLEVDDKSMLRHSAGDCFPAAVNVLLAAGADETVRDLEGCIPSDAIGVELRMAGFPVNWEKGFAIRRMLEHGPAYRARSWAWPAEQGGCGDVGAVVPSPPAPPKAPVSVRIFRPKDDRNFFVSVVDRYCRKG